MFGHTINTLHPMLVHFPIALLSTGWLCDVLGIYFQKDSLRHAGWWSQVFGIISIPFTIITGIFADSEIGHMANPFPIFETHGMVQILASLLFIGLFIWRWKLKSELPPKTQLYIYLIIGGAAILLLFYGGHLGAKIAMRI